MKVKREEGEDFEISWAIFECWQCEEEYQLPEDCTHCPICGAEIKEIG